MTWWGGDLRNKDRQLGQEGEFHFVHVLEAPGGHPDGDKLGGKPRLGFSALEITTEMAKAGSQNTNSQRQVEAGEPPRGEQGRKPGETRRMSWGGRTLWARGDEISAMNRCNQYQGDQEVRRY